MISIIIRKDQNGAILGFSSEGHAGYEDEGKDIICASISTLYTTAVNSLEDQLGWKNHYLVSGQESNFCEVFIPDDKPEEEKKIAQIILRTIVRGILDVEESVKQNYGKKFLQVTTKRQ